MVFRIALIIVLFGVACAPFRGARSSADDDRSAPSAEIGDDYARFVFPSQSKAPWVAPAAVERYPDESVGYFWEVGWPERSAGVDPRIIRVVAAWKALSPPKGPLEVMVRNASIDVLKLCGQCNGYPAATVLHERVLEKPAITAEMKRGSVVVTVRGRPTIARLFPQRPNAISFYIQPPNGDLVYLTVAVKKRLCSALLR